jgi:hypothetical protein
VLVRSATQELQAMRATQELQETQEILGAAQEAVAAGGVLGLALS